MKTLLLTSLLLTTFNLFAASANYQSFHSNYCDNFILDRLVTHDWYLNEDDYNEAKIIKIERKNGPELYIKGIFNLRYLVRAGYDLEDKAPTNSDYKVYVKFVENESEVSCKIKNIYTKRGRR
ncbi:MAG: hypothetical protein ISR65_11155 [Bacteriovoracaceae bacterium]|nr:hypothetical protein [Bacteriovoracaceae bacterium]